MVDQDEVAPPISPLSAKQTLKPLPAASLAIPAPLIPPPNMNISYMSVSEHDLIFAMTSHLPHLVSYALIDSIRLSPIDVADNAGGGLKEFLRLSGSNPEMWRDIFTLNRVDLIKALAGMQVSLNNLLELITEAKEIPDVLSHLEILKDELNEIKSFKEDKF